MDRNSLYPGLGTASRANSSTRVDISSLMSPPEPLADSFNQDAAAEHENPKRALPLPMSPPLSPSQKNNDVTANPRASASPPIPSQLVTDPVLYPAEDPSAAPSVGERPLFLESQRLLQEYIDRHERDRPDELFKVVSPPRREDYDLVLTFKCRLMELYNKDRNSWLRRERALLLADRERARQGRRFLPAGPRPIARPVRQRPERAPKPASARQTTRSFFGPPSSSSRAPPAASPSRPLSAHAAPNREDKDFHSIPDYAPPLSSLKGNRPNSLKTEWKGQPINLDNDPFRHLLHPDEVLLAAGLRLDCATYLTSKRRIFERRLQCFRNGKEFRKTDAQQACNIDVNKASKLWIAFDKVGWLQPQWMMKYM